MLSKIIYGVVALLTLAACTQDDITGAGNTLPNGEYPLRIISVSANAEGGGQQTRVEESVDGNRSMWTVGDKIGVRIGDGTPGTYLLNADGTINADDFRPAYWATTASNQTINAWYPADASVSLADQSGGLVYVLKAEPVIADYNTLVSLNFTHLLAKVRVELKGTADHTDGEVYIKGSTTCTNIQGTVSGSNDGWIQMHFAKYSDGTTCYEANVVPGTLAKENAFRVTNDSGKSVEVSLDGEMTLTAGELHKVTLTINDSNSEEVYLSQQEDGQNYTPGTKNCIIYGEGKEVNQSLTIMDGGSVVLNNVNLNSRDYYAIVTHGNTTIVLDGDFTLKAASNYAPIHVWDGTLTINGTSADKLTLQGVEGIFSGTLAINEGANVIINGGHIIADGSKTGGAAGIGTFGGSSGGTITINGAA